MTKYSQSLKQHLELSGQSQVVFAKRLGIAQPTVNRWVHGARHPDAKTARRIEKVTDGAVPFELWSAVALQRLVDAA